MHNTKMDDFKYALYSVKDTFSKDDEKLWTVIENINDCIEKLLNDELMMKPNNNYTFAERTMATRLNLINSIALVLSEDAGKPDGFFNKAQKILKAINNTGMEIRSKQIGI